MERYEKYKDSGVEWIGEIPGEWEVNALKRFAKICNGQDHKTVWDENGEYPIIGSGGVFGKSNKFLYDQPSVILGRKGTIDKPRYIDTPFWTVDTAYYTEISPKIDNRFFYYLCLTINFDLYKYGSAVPSMNQETLSQIPFTSPPKPEQTTIANYLDRKTAEIDKLIAQKERLLSLYEEEKTAIINQAVTQGINPDVKLKDSAIDWLGEIPEHWKIKRLRYIGSCQNGVSKGGDYFGSGFPFISYGDVYNDFILPQQVKGLAESTENDRVNYSVRKGDILFTRTSETADEIGLTSTCLKTVEDAIFSGFLIRFRPNENNLFEGFSKYYFSSTLHRLFFVKEMNIVTRASLSQDLLKKLPVLLPSIQEQKQIALYLDEAMEHINAKIAKTQKIITLQKEYRTALISEVVTGKIKVVQDAVS